MAGNPDLVTWAYWVKNLMVEQPVFHRIVRRERDRLVTPCGQLVWIWNAETKLTERGYWLAPLNAIRMGRACKRCFR